MEGIISFIMTKDHYNAQGNRYMTWLLGSIMLVLVQVLLLVILLLFSLCIASLSLLRLRFSFTLKWLEWGCCHYHHPHSQRVGKVGAVSFQVQGPEEEGGQ